MPRAHPTSSDVLDASFASAVSQLLRGQIKTVVLCRPGTTKGTDSESRILTGIQVRLAQRKSGCFSPFSLARL